MTNSRDPNPNIRLDDSDLAALRAVWRAQKEKKAQPQSAPPDTRYKAVDESMKEFYNVQKRFFKDMQDLGLSEQLQKALLPNEIEMLTELFKPLKSLTNPFRSHHEDTSYTEQFTHLIEQAQTTTFKGTYLVMRDAMLVGDMINNLVSEIKKRRSFDLELQTLLGQEVTAQMSKPFQNIMRWGSMSEAISGYYLKALGIKHNNKEESQKMIAQLSASTTRSDADNAVLKLHEMEALFKGYSELANIEKKIFDENNPHLRKLQFTDEVLSNLVFSKVAHDIAVEIEDIADLDERTAAVGMLYVNAYVGGRTKGIGTVKTSTLEDLEKTFIDAIDPEFDPASYEQKPDTFLFSKLAEVPGLRTALVNNLFVTALTEGVANNNELIYANSIKAVIRLGNQAILQWNDKVTREFGDKKILKIDLSFFDDKGNYVYMKEKEVSANFSAIRKDKDISNNLSEQFFAQRLQSALRQVDRTSLNPAQTEKLNALIQHTQGSAGVTNQQIHNAFIEKYLDLYITDRGKSGKSPLLDAVEKAVTKVFQDYHKIHKTDQADYKDRVDAMILGTVGASEKITLVAELAKRVQTVVKDNNKAEFINIGKAIVRMHAVTTWNGYVPTKLKLSEKVKESDIEKMYPTQQETAKHPFWKTGLNVSTSKTQSNSLQSPQTPDTLSTPRIGGPGKK
jgi:hypothetical protein